MNESPSEPGGLTEPGGPFAALGRVAVRHPRLIIAAWVVVVAVSALLAPRLHEVFEREFVQGNLGEGQQAADLVAERFSDRSPFQELLVLTSDAITVDDPAYRDAAEALFADLASESRITSIQSYFSGGGPALVSEDGRTTYALLNLGSANHADAMTVSGEIVERVQESPLPPWLQAYVTGAEAIHADVTTESQASLTRAETVGLPVALAVLIAVFGALVASALPLAMGVIAIVVALAAAFIVGQFLSLSVFVENFSTMLGLGLGIDYSLFLITRYRAEREAGRVRDDAVVHTVAQAGKAVAFSGGTVAIGLSALLATQEPTIASIGIGGLLVVTAAVAAALTLLPAALALLGDRVDAPRSLTRQVRRLHRGGFWAGWAHGVMRRPVAFSLLGAGLIVAMAWPATALRTSPIGVELLGSDVQSRVGYETIAREFGPGVADPLQIVVSSERGIADPRVLAGIDRLTRAIDASPRFAGALSISSIMGELPAEQAQLVAREGIGAIPAALQAQLGEFVNLDAGADTAIVIAYPNLDAGGSATEAVDELRDRIIPGVPELDGATVLVGGTAAIQADAERAVYARLPLVIGLILTTTFVLLLLLFRSIVIPLKAVIMNLLSVFAAYGLLVAVFQFGIGAPLLGFEPGGGVNWLTPVLLFAVLFGLSMDYEVFLMSRMRELHESGHSNEESVALGLERTGGVITGAAAIMVVVFGAFVLSSVLIIKELGFALAVAVLVDATVVRVIFVPATMRLLGEWNWWLPSWLDRWLPRLELEREASRALVSEPAP